MGDGQGDRNRLDADPLATTTEASPAANPLGQRRALRRLNGATPSAFEQLIDLIYEYRELEPYREFTEIIRTLLNKNHNINDKDAIFAFKGLIHSLRVQRVVSAAEKVGLDQAEKLLAEHMGKGDER